MRRSTPNMMLESTEVMMDTVQNVVGPVSTKLALKTLRLDGGTQPRSEINASVVTNYAEAIGNGAVLPPITAFYDGSVYWVGDGFHRCAAYAQLGLAEILVDVRQGTQRDAVLYSVGANATHGLPRSDEDKRRAVLRLLEDSEWSKWADNEIARRCKVNAHLVAKLRLSMLPSIDSAPPVQRKVERNGSTYVMNTARIGLAPVVFKSEWSTLTWAVYDWAMTKAGQPIQSLKDLGYFKDKDQKWPRLVAHLKSQGFIELDKSVILSSCSTVLRALREDAVPQRTPDTVSEPEPEPIPVAVPEPEPVYVEPVTVKAEPALAVTSGTKLVAHHDTYQPSHLEVKHGPEGRKILVMNVAGKREVWVELLPEQASWLAGELLS